MILRLACLAALLSLAAEALQAPSNAHIAITGPAPLAKAVGAKCVFVGVPRADSSQNSGASGASDPPLMAR